MYQPSCLNFPISIQVCLDEMLAAEVGPEIHDLPSPQGNEQHGGSNSEPLDASVGALVRVSQLLLSRAQVVHLGNDFRDGLLDTAQVSLDGLQLLGGLDRRPVFRVGTDVNVKLDVAVGVVRPWMIWSAPCPSLANVLTRAHATRGATYFR